MYRVKEIRQKNSSGSFDVGVPLGTDGILVDMLSGLDNEEELKLGGNHNSYIEEVSDSVTRITETYYDLAGTTVEYTVITLITENANGSTTIEVSLSKVGTLVRSKTVTIPADAASMMIREELDD